ncbi:cellulase family glycosylhydrolase [Georgenia thermotolerans]|uniref:Cellulase family glycosylhydrolase n=1 Tax=Georgenia thermotolerans TaxID=527326 RepID=A0A7J5UNS9_9MICO|nr:cellulase family glycosylhydrolase [Georgenia thermotolerans]KAE8763891.1 cellulase family glycosylhydrolase [Georgenia thermotolerans]
MQPTRPPRPSALARLRGALLAIPLLALAACTESTRSAPEPSRTPDALTSTDPEGFVRAEGRHLVLGEERVRLKAVNFSNFYHRDLAGADLLSSAHHSAADFARVRELGFNSIRFAIDGDWHADAPDLFWDWLDQNVAWAREHGLRLILDLHTPVDSFWLDPTSDRVSFDLWTDPDARRRNVDLWREVATRYADEPAIAAYDLLNEPVTVDETGQQWRDLARDLVAAVRAVDDNHLLIVGGLYGVAGRYGIDPAEAHFLVDDDNVAYDFHFYEPVAYTHQYATWVEGPVQDGGAYPDPQAIVATGPRQLLLDSRIVTPSLPSGTTGWQVYDSGPVEVADEAAVAAMPMVVAQGGMRGTAYVDGVRVIEYGPDGTELRQIVDDPLDADGTVAWYSWQSGGVPARFARETGVGLDDGASLSVGDAGGDDAVAGWSNDRHLFPVVPGNRYRILGHMRGEGVKLDGDGVPGTVGLRLDVYAASPGAAGDGFLPRDKALLEHELMKHVRFGAEHDVPMSVMELGVVRQAFEMEGKGGDGWVADVLALLDEHDLSFAYWEYHGAQMGLYLGADAPPAEPNEPLHRVLGRELRRRAAGLVGAR